MDKVYASKGKKISYFNLKDGPSEEDVLAVLLGPTGNLRAPLIRKGRTLIVGFNQEQYQKVFS